MSTFKRNGLFPFYKEDQPQDWQISGYYDEFLNSLQLVPRDVLKSFRTPNINAVITSDITSIFIRRLSIFNGIKTILETNEYTVTINRQFVDENSKTCSQSNAVYTYYYFNQSAISDNPIDYLDSYKLYEIYIEDTLGNKFISNTFIAIDETEIFINTEDGQIILDETGEGILFE
jgi:hypothetical protein